MKKSTLLKLAFLFVAILTIGSANAQVVDGAYSQYDPLAVAPANVDYVTLKTGGTTMGYYALPDPAYHSNYNAAGSWALTANFVWDWTIPTNPGAATVSYPVPLVPGPGNKPANYAQITYPAVGNYVVNVKEHAPAAFGGCVDATGQNINVTVVAPPTGTSSINPGGAWNVITANAAYQICGTQAAQTVTVTFNEAVPSTLAGFSFAIASKVETIDGSDAVIDVKTPYAIVEDFTPVTGDRLKTGQVGLLSSAAFTAGNPTSTFTFNTPALTVLTKGATTTLARTKYTFKLVQSGTVINAGTEEADVTAAAKTFRSAISQKSDFLSTATYFTFTNNEVYFIVNPTPVTGPIYHISNTYAY